MPNERAGTLADVRHIIVWGGTISEEREVNVGGMGIPEGYDLGRLLELRDELDYCFRNLDKPACLRRVFSVAAEIDSLVEEVAGAVPGRTA